MSLASRYAITGPIVIEAVHGVGRYRLPYWDALIWATAKANGVGYVLTEDTHADEIEGGALPEPFRGGI